MRSEVRLNATGFDIYDITQGKVFYSGPHAVLVKFNNLECLLTKIYRTKKSEHLSKANDGGPWIFSLSS